MNLAHGGHLTHGHPLNFSGKTYKMVPYGVRKEDESIDYDELARLAEEHKPKMIIAGASAYPRIIDFKRFREIADSVGAILLVDMAHFSGLVAAGVYPNPCEYADIVTSTTHKTLRGPRSGHDSGAGEIRQGRSIRRSSPARRAVLWFTSSPAKAVCFLEAMRPISGYQKQVVANAQALACGIAQRDIESFRAVRTLTSYWWTFSRKAFAEKKRKLLSDNASHHRQIRTAFLSMSTRR